MPIHLRLDLVKRLAHSMYGGYDQLTAAWEDRCENDPSSPRAKQRASLYRWEKAGVPTRRDGSDHQYFALCGLLDVDPLAIFDFQKNGYFSRFAKIRQLVYIGRTQLGGIATLLDMYRPSDFWPSDAIATKCFGHPWHAQHLTNHSEWDNTNYILIKCFFGPSTREVPRAVHVAYRRIGVPDTMWRYYGTVLAVDGKLELYSESGSYQESMQLTPDEVCFRTYFGGRPVEWRLASIHQFTIKTEYPCQSEGIVTFKW
jgi:hypothetical protein